MCSEMPVTNDLQQVFLGGLGVTFTFSLVSWVDMLNISSNFIESSLF